MKTAPLLSALLAFGSPLLAGPQPADPPPAPLTADQRTFLEGEGFNPELLSPEAARAARNDPAAFHKDYAQFQSWRANPKLLHAAAKKDRAEVEGSVARMSAFLTPEEAGLLQSNFRLSPHALEARVPEGSGFESRRRDSPPAAASPVTAGTSRPPAAAGDSAADFRAGPKSLTTAAVPAAAPRANPPPAEKPWWQDSLDFYYCRLYPARCGR